MKGNSRSCRLLIVNAIDVKNFSKSFGKKLVVTDINFELSEGEILAFLGANGSGKTTTIRSLLNIYQPDSGSLEIFGQPYSAARSSLLGYLPEERGIYLDANVLETLVYFASLKGLTKLDAKQRALSYLETVGLADKADQKIKQLSSGQQQKIQLGLCLVARPKLLILDEPTKGLDPINRQLFTDIFKKLNQEEGTSILFSTHMMEEAERVADKVVMIHNAQRVLYGDILEIKSEYTEDIVSLQYRGKLPDKFTTVEDINRLSAVEITAKLKANKSLTDFMQEVLRLESSLDIIKVGSYVPSLQEIFVRISQN